MGAMIFLYIIVVLGVVVCAIPVLLGALGIYALGTCFVGLMNTPDREEKQRKKQEIAEFREREIEFQKYSAEWLKRHQERLRRYEAEQAKEKMVEQKS
ncbi:MAG: hypothetical protein LBS41_06385 [Streptococcaceae bacterium]|jgi:Flp pilus assembly protein TadB|nr:hypothetical protein [Streptococcaceae bacterium]